MAYIGAEPLPGQNREVDDISSGFNGSTTAFTLQVNGLNVSPETANNILVNIGGVIQNPGTDYTIAASTITFTTAPASGLSFFAIILGAGINTATVADDTIGPSKLIDTAVTAGSYTTADITVDAQGRITAAASGTISGAEIADQAVTNAKVNNSAAIAVSKLANFVTNNATDRIITGSGTTNTLNGRSDFTFNGATTTITNSSGLNKLILKGAASGALGASLQLRNTNTDNNGLTDIQFLDPGSNTYAKIQGTNLTDSSNNGFLTFFTASATSGLTERVRIDDSGNVGIGTSAPTDYNNLAENLVVATSSDTGITVASGTSSQGSLFFADGTSGSAMVEGFVAYEHNNNALKIGTSNSERMRIDSTGNVVIGSSSNSGSNRLYVVDSHTDTFVNPTDSILRIENADTSGTTGQASISLSVKTSGSTADSAIVANAEDASGNSNLRFFTDTSNGMSEKMRISSAGKVGVGVTSPAASIDLVRGGNECIRMENTTGVRLRMILKDSAGRDGEIEMNTGHLLFSLEDSGSLTTYFRLNNDSKFFFGNQTNLDPANGNVVGFSGQGSLGFTSQCRDSDVSCVVGRKGNDGQLIRFHQDGTQEGNIAVSGSTVSYNGGHLSRWSQIKGLSRTDKSARPEIYQGTVMSNLDELCEWEGEENQQLNMTKISEIEGDKDVAGVFWAWDDDDDEIVNDFYIAMTGDMVIRVAASTTVARGDLLVSAGDGTAKPQADDIIRSSTIAKIISTTATATYSDGSKAYPCVLMAC